ANPPLGSLTNYSVPHSTAPPGLGMSGQGRSLPEPKTARGRQRKRAIISAAAALMYEHGVKATAVDDVLVASGCGKSQFYHYFSSKDDLVAAVLDLQLETVFDGVSEFRLDTWSGIRAWFDSLIAGQEQRGFKGCLSARCQSS
ncbi:MAG: TetR/AcrR family transcriptional regulator, partial [Actinobacteria bacterium]|nr:TetR/AcrR family transcriptional regulator [Actinomycetota bacterium]